MLGGVLGCCRVGRRVLPVWICQQIVATRRIACLNAGTVVLRAAGRVSHTQVAETRLGSSPKATKDQGNTEVKYINKGNL